MSGGYGSQLRLAWVALLGFVVLVPGLVSAAAIKSPLKVLSVAIPVPPGAEPNGQMALQATVRSRVGFGNATVTFYLAANPYSGPDNIEIGSATVSLFSLFLSPGPVGLTADVPQDVSPGFYYLLACAGANNCAASSQTVTITGQELSRLPQSPLTAMSGPPGPEFFPESTPGMSVGAPFNCPASGNGQSGSQCVWVTTQSIPVTPPILSLSLFYCPASNPYPYQVLFGHDVLWEDLSTARFGLTNGISFTKYQQDALGFNLSYAGPRGYAVFFWSCVGPLCNSPGTGKVRYMCSTLKTRRAIP